MSEEKLDERWTDRKVPMMKCGCAAQGMDENGNPVCIVHAGLVAGWNQVAEEEPELEGRLAKCSMCNTKAKSKSSLPFFEHQPDQELDRYYCGCWGWD